MGDTLHRGFIQVYTGEGKGKTTAAFGQALRAVGRGLKAAIIQFLKDGNSGEVISMGRLAPEMRVFSFGGEGFCLRPSQEDFLNAQRGLAKAEDLMGSGGLDILILDEICMAVHLGLVKEASVLKIMKEKPCQMELILTGRNASKGIIEYADLVTEMKTIKHPYTGGIKARLGIEY
ncbi:MAG: cob(I)yrinic acid a,c-diamide adenosyltransferase [Clostridia bacterium]|nr:cob(I)yrinic acid a,c-diamide adenosyltransferase [Clostridia bacterium]